MVGINSRIHNPDAHPVTRLRGRAVLDGEGGVRLVHIDGLQGTLAQQVAARRAAPELAVRKSNGGKAVPQPAELLQ